MPYTPPSSEELAKSIESLLTDYPGNNEERKALIKIVQAIHQSKTATAEARRGAMYIAYLKLTGTYYLPAEKKTLFGYKFHGSELDDLLRKGLKLGPDNVMEDQDIILIMSELYGELERHPSTYADLIKSLQPQKSWFANPLASSSFWKNFDKLKNHVVETVKPYIFKHSETIASAINNAITAQILKEELTKLIADYRALGKGYPYHDELINFLEFINIMSDIYTEPNKEKMGLDKNAAKLFTMAYQLRLAAYCFVLEEIENERTAYRIWLASPEGSLFNKGSDLYKLMRPIFSIVRIKKMNPDDRETCIKELLSFLDKQKFAELEKIAKQNHNIHVGSDKVVESVMVDDKVVESVKKNLNNFSRKLILQLDKISQIPRTPPTTVAGTVADNIAFVTEYGINAAIAKGATLLVPDIGKQAARATGGLAGYLLFGPAGAFLGAVAAEHIISSLLPSTASGGFIMTAKPVTQTVGKITGGTVAIPIYLAEKGIKYVLSSDPEVRKKQEECLAANQKMMTSLKYLPPKAFPNYMSLARERKETESVEVVIDGFKDLEVGKLTPESSELLTRRVP